MKSGDSLTKAQWLHATAYVQSQLDYFNQHVQALLGIGVHPDIANSFRPSDEAVKLTELMAVMRDRMEDLGFTNTRDTFLSFAKDHSYDVDYDSGADRTWMKLHRAMGVTEEEMHDAMLDARKEDTERLMKLANGQS